MPRPKLALLATKVHTNAVTEAMGLVAPHDRGSVANDLVRESTRPVLIAGRVADRS